MQRRQLSCEGRASGCLPPVARLRAGQRDVAFLAQLQQPSTSNSLSAYPKSVSKAKQSVGRGDYIFIIGEHFKTVLKRSERQALEPLKESERTPGVIFFSSSSIF